MSSDTVDYVNQFQIKQIVDKLKYKTYDFKITEKFGKGENYLGEIKRTQLTGTKEDGNVEKLDLIIKTIPEALRQNDKIPVVDVFKNEVFMYNDYLSKLMDIQNEANLSDDDIKFKLAPCFAFCESPEKEVLVFKDMRSEGFTMYDRFKSLDYDHLFLSVKVLASFHALSFALKERTSKEDYMKILKSLVPMKDNPDMVKFEEHAASVGLKHIDSEEDKKIFEKFTKGNVSEYNRKVLYFDPDYLYGIIIHRDFWTNNLLFSYENGHPKEMVTLDWQISQYCTPVIDLLYLIYLCLDEETRDKYYDELLDTYYETLKTRLTALNCDANKCYPEEVFRKELKEYHGFAILNALMMLPFILNKKEDSVDLSDVLTENPDDMFGAMKHSDAFIKRWNGVLRHLIKHDVL